MSESRASEIRDGQRTAWDGLAAGWAKWDPLIQDQLGPLGTAIIDNLGISPTQRHLDVASGTGEPGLSIAHLAPQGRITLTDVSPGMLGFARSQAAAQGLTNVETAVCSADDLPFHDGAFDSVSVRLGYMFFPDLAAATAEFVRVLRPGGRLAAVVWVDPAQNPWTSIVMAAIEGEVTLPATDPDGPHMYRCGAPGQISALYEQAGLREVAERDLDVFLVTASPEEYWSFITEKVSIAVAALRDMDEPARERARARALDAVGAYAWGGGVRVPGRARCIVGTKPSART